MFFSLFSKNQFIHSFYDRAYNDSLKEFFMVEQHEKIFPRDRPPSGFGCGGEFIQSNPGCYFFLTENPIRAMAPTIIVRIDDGSGTAGAATGANV